MRTSAPTLGTLAPGQTFACGRPLLRLKGASGVLELPDRSQPDPLSSTETRSARSKNRLIGFIVAIARATGADSKLLSTLSTAQDRRASSDAPKKIECLHTVWRQQGGRDWERFTSTVAKDSQEKPQTL